MIDCAGKDRRLPMTEGAAPVEAATLDLVRIFNSIGLSHLKQLARSRYDAAGNLGNAPEAPTGAGCRDCANEGMSQYHSGDGTGGVNSNTTSQPKSASGSCSLTLQDGIGGNGTPFSSEEPTPIVPSSGGLADRTIVSLRQAFSKFEHEPSPAMWNGLNAVAMTLDSMASGTCEPAVYVSSLDPGVGKTQLVVHFLRELLRSPEHQTVGAIICVNRKDQIRSIVDDAALERFAVLTADPDVNAIATAEVNEARVLFTTQQMIEARCQHVGSFQAATAFHFNGQPRAVRIWDEAMLTAQANDLALAEVCWRFGPDHPEPVHLSVEGRTGCADLTQGFAVVARPQRFPAFFGFELRDQIGGV